MPYTSQGWMSHQQVQETLKDLDMGTTEIQLDDAPDWFDSPETCPVCGSDMDDHDSVRIIDASGEIFACLPIDSAGWLELEQ